VVRKKREAVAVSFHTLNRYENDEDDSDRLDFTVDEFAILVTRLGSLKPLDFQDEKIKDRLRFKNLAPIDRVVSIDERTCAGTYRGSYWGHAYDNTDVGKIPAESISLRPFHFLLYLNESGGIELGSQYIGQFGSYTSLKNTIISFLPDRGYVKALSYRRDAQNIERLEPREVRVTVARKPTRADGDNILSNERIVTFKKGREDAGFESKVKQALYKIKPGGSGIRAAAAEIMKQNRLMLAEDDQITDVRIFGSVDGKSATIYMIEPGLFASQFPIVVSYDADGHPQFGSAVKAMIEVLESEILAHSAHA
jgi:hypothetical protein